MKKTLGGDRLGSGNKMTVDLPGFGRSSHNIGCIVKTDQSIATIVPYLCDIATNGTTYYMDINVKDRTLPTTSAPFASMKHQIDVFAIPLRLYMSALHNNTLGIGLKMNTIKLPKMELRFNQPTFDDSIGDNPNWQQISQDTLLAYTGVRGGGVSAIQSTQSFSRRFPAMFVLAYYDIYKNYYANKQEEVGYIITNGINGQNVQFVSINDSGRLTTLRPGNISTNAIDIGKGATILVTFANVADREDFLSMKLRLSNGIKQIREFVDLTTIEGGGYSWNATVSTPVLIKANEDPFVAQRNDTVLKQFDLSNIDDMREAILQAPWGTEFKINSLAKSPYLDIIKDAEVEEANSNGNANYFSQNGLAVRTYLSDRFNNYLSNEWIDGVNGINEITAVDVSDGKLTMDALILQEKLFKMLNRIAISDGSFAAWQEAVYGMKAISMTESPIYVGGMSSEIVFGEIVSNSASGDEPLGTLAGKGMDVNKKGGKLKIKVKEPSMIMVLGSIVPRVDYSQGNQWWMELDSMDDLHKPSLDAIGFQELTTEEFAAWDTAIDEDGNAIYNSVGKQPSWIQYMTNQNKSYGSFSAGGELSFMAPNRVYHANSLAGGVRDATTYIDPRIFNNLFADQSLSAKPIWVQVAFDLTARRVMSAKQIPNL